MKRKTLLILLIIKLGGAVFAFGAQNFFVPVIEAHEFTSSASGMRKSSTSSELAQVTMNSLAGIVMALSKRVSDLEKEKALSRARIVALEKGYHALAIGRKLEQVDDDAKKKLSRSDSYLRTVLPKRCVNPDDLWDSIFNGSDTFLPDSRSLLQGDDALRCNKEDFLEDRPVSAPCSGGYFIPDDQEEDKEITNW